MIKPEMESVHLGLITPFSDKTPDTLRALQQEALPVNAHDRNILQNAVKLSTKVFKGYKNLEKANKRLKLFPFLRRKIGTSIGKKLLTNLWQLDQQLGNEKYSIKDIKEVSKTINDRRELSMAKNALQAADNGISAVWKIGENHLQSLLQNKTISSHTNIKLISKNELKTQFDEMKKNRVQHSKKININNNSRTSLSIRI